MARSYVYLVMCCPSEQANSSWTNEKLQEVAVKQGDLLTDVLRLLRLQAGKAIPDPRQAQLCDYHHHSKVEVCPNINKKINREFEKELSKSMGEGFFRAPNVSFRSEN